MKKHPEQQAGEKFITNIAWYGDDILDSHRNLQAVEGPATHKRLGRIAYDTSGNELPGMRPVFLTKKKL